MLSFERRESDSCLKDAGIPPRGRKFAETDYNKQLC